VQYEVTVPSFEDKVAQRAIVSKHSSNPVG
jgi:hypothetical protein